MASSRFASFLVLGLLAACAERDPLDGATVGGTGGSTEAPPPASTGTSSAEPTTDPTEHPTFTTTGEPTTGEPTTAAATSGTTVLDTGDITTGGPVGAEEFLLAISSVIDPGLPLQFLATTTFSADVMRLELQPLGLDQGKVSTPRVPVGEPLVFDMIPVKDGQFVIDFGLVLITGAANPITGSDITATLQASGSVVSEDFYCGTVDGQLMMPIQSGLTGSTFAAVRLADPSQLPFDVPINCAGDTVSDP